MHKVNTNYTFTGFGHNLDIRGNEVMIYPENKLPDLVVTSDFGDCKVECSDLYDLFNQQRISNLGADVVRDFVARHYPTSSAISEQISKMSDTEIMDSIKPRNIQSYSELMSWSKYLNMKIENGLKSIELSPESSPEPELDADSKIE